MGFSSVLFLSLLAVLPFSLVHGDPLVAALIIFGDSTVDPGNNNKLYTSIKANFPPYGRDYVTHRPTGRFSNGKLVIDFIAEYLGFPSFPPAYLSQEARGKNLLIGANFASAGSGYYDMVAESYGTITLTRQLHYFEEYQTKVVNMVGQAKANDILSDAIYVLCAGSSDSLSYKLNPLLNRVFPPDQFSGILVTSYAKFIQQNLHALGARKIGVTTIPPIGCLPAIITLFGSGSNQCIASVNQAAISFNKELNRTSESLQNKLPGLKLVLLDIYRPLLDMITRPAINGFSESRRACCGSGVLETALLCNTRSVGTCTNATGFVFWDGFHRTETANKIMAGDLMAQGRSLIP